MKKVLFMFTFALAITGSVNAFAKSDCVPASDKAQDRTCTKLTTEAACTNSKDLPKCNWSVSHANPNPPNKEIKCYPVVKAGQKPDAKDGACLTMKEQTKCEDKNDNFNCAWHETVAKPYGCLPKGKALWDAACSKIQTEKECLSPTDKKMSCTWVAQDAETDSSYDYAQ